MPKLPGVNHLEVSLQREELAREGPRIYANKKIQILISRKKTGQPNIMACHWLNPGL